MSIRFLCWFFRLKERRIYRISALFFTSLLILNFGLIIYYNNQVSTWRNQDQIADNITDSVNELTFLLNEYSVNASNKGWTLLVAAIQRKHYAINSLFLK